MLLKNCRKRLNVLEVADNEQDLHGFETFTASQPSRFLRTGAKPSRSHELMPKALRHQPPR